MVFNFCIYLIYVRNVFTNSRFSFSFQMFVYNNIDDVGLEELIFLRRKILIRPRVPVYVYKIDKCRAVQKNDTRFTRCKSGPIYKKLS